MTDTPLEQILSDYKRHLLVEKMFNQPKEYLKEVFGDAIDVSNKHYVFCKSAEITDYFLLPRGEYHLLDGVELVWANALSVIPAGAIFRFGDNSHLKIHSGRFFAQGTEQEQVYFLPTAPGNECDIEIHTPIANRMFYAIARMSAGAKKDSIGKMPPFAGLDFCIFEGLNGWATNAALNLSEGWVRLNNCEITGCSGYQGGAIHAHNTHLHVIGGRIANNYASASGGALFAVESNTLFEDVDIEQNSNSNTLGGAITVHGNKGAWPKEEFDDIENMPDLSESYEFRNCRIRNNTGKGGGAFYVMKGLVKLDDDCVLEGNSKPQIFVSDLGGMVKCNPEVIKDGN